MSRSRNLRKLMRHQRRPSELQLISMIDIFTVLVTFLLMTAVFSRTVILELRLPSQNADFKEPPPGLQLEVIVHKDNLQIADRSTGPLRTLPLIETGYDFKGLSDYLQFVKSRYPDKIDAAILLEPDTPYDTLVQVMDKVRVVEIPAGIQTVQAELFPEISIGDAPTDAPAGGAK